MRPGKVVGLSCQFLVGGGVARLAGLSIPVGGGLARWWDCPSRFWWEVGGGVAKLAGLSCQFLVGGRLARWWDCPAHSGRRWYGRLVGGGRRPAKWWDSPASLWWEVVWQGGWHDSPQTGRTVPPPSDHLSPETGRTVPPTLPDHLPPKTHQKTRQTQANP
ncbi:hypothetical protein M407DRAFT_10613 [Tulasnella calospora MUT 4182]|uniref:Uncharacterized protein n=1 Tax=Tulasnella calospora MUT 4182 TaxID=1051891 RepID=A0A0C3QAB0_9AGAM|nr:hypothetical protein M407DRAFT_10613 [Tulasnella calospora MUT 4182]